MKVGVENHGRLNGIKIPSIRGRTKMLTSFESHWFDLVIFATPPARACHWNKVKYSTVKCKHLMAVLVYFTKVFRETSGEKYNEFKGVNFFPMRARTKVLASFESQWIELAWRNNYLGQSESRYVQNISSHSSSRTLKQSGSPEKKAG